MVILFDKELLERFIKSLEMTEKNFKTKAESVSMEEFDMLAQAYKGKCDECEELKKEINELNKGMNNEEENHFQAYKKLSAKCNELENANRELTEELSKYRYFIECQKNEIEKL